MPIQNLQNFDSCVSFFIENGAYQGRLIRLNHVLNEILSRHAYPLPVSAVLAENTVLAAMLSSTIKYEGLFTLQTQSDGPVSMIVVDVTSDGKIRAYARYDETHLNNNQQLRKKTGEIEASPHLMGNGHIAFTVDQGPDTELYQGIVDLQGKTLSECALRYFKQSEQIDTDIKLFLQAPEGDSKQWLGAGIMLQKMPVKGGKEELDEDAAKEAWEEAKIFMQSLNANEIFDAALTPEDLLHRLFHAHNLQISNCRNYEFKCRCGRDKLLNTLSGFSEEEINSMLENNKISATCQFCSEQYCFDKGELIKQ